MSNQAAVLKEAKGALTVENLSIPKPGPSDLLVKNHAISTCPVDWKMRDNDLFIEKYPVILGSDMAGTVETVGSSVTGFSAGDRVTGFADVIMSKDPRNGAFQQYTILKDCAATKLPSATTFEQASILPMSVATAGVGLFLNMDIPRPPTKSSGGFLVWGGSSSVGTATIQIAKALGFTVFTTSSPRHHEYLKKLGAESCCDYSDSSVVDKITDAAKASGQKITAAFDAVCESGSSPIAAAVLEAFGGGKLCLTMPYPEDAKKPAGVEISNTLAARIVGDQKDFGKWLFGEWLATALANGTYVPSPAIEKVDGGLGAVQKALDIHKKGLSGKKLVLTI